MNSNRQCSLWNVSFVVCKATLGYYGLALGKKYSIAHQTFLTIPPTQSNYNNTPIATGHLYTFCKTSADHTAGFPICICSFALFNKTLKWDWLLKCHFLWLNWRIQCPYVQSLLNFSNKSWAKVCSIKLCFVHRLIVTFNLFRFESVMYRESALYPSTPKITLRRYNPPNRFIPKPHPY